MLANNGLLVPNRAHPLNANKVAWWKILPRTFGGGRLIDIWGSQHAYHVNLPKWSGYAYPGSSGSILYASASSQYFDCGLQLITSKLALGSFSVACWFNALTLPSAGQLIGRNDSQDATGGWSVGYHNADGGLGFDKTSATANNVRARATFSSTAVWHHLAVTYNGGTAASGVKLYLDGGSLAATTAQDGTGTLTNGDTTYALQIGGNSGAGTFWGFWDGFIDDVQIWKNRILTASDILGVYTLSRLGYPGMLTRKSAVSWFPVQPASGAFNPGWAAGATSFVLGGIR